MTSSVSQSQFASRTQQYVQALVQEGDNFDPAAWLKQVRENGVLEGKGGGQVVSADTFSNKAQPQKVGVTQSFGKLRERPLSPLGQPARGRHLRPPPRFPSSHRQPLLTQRLRRVEAVWTAVTRKHRRFAIYGYLSAVFDLVTRCRHRRETKKLFRCMTKLTGLVVQRDTDPFAAVIRCTADANLDRKIVSRWSRALRYIAACKNPDISLKDFIRHKGGINACAGRFSRMRKRHAGR